MLEDRYHRGKFDEMTDRADAPLEDAVALMVRERLTGKPPPSSGEEARRAVAGSLRSRTGRGDFERLAEYRIEDQVALRRRRPRSDRSLDMGRIAARDAESKRRRPGARARPATQTRARGLPTRARRRTPPTAAHVEASKEAEAG
jgi:cobaltochelatase CobT